LYYYRARYYDAELGRFISQDPIGIADDINLYNYVGGNPVNYNDALGLLRALILEGVDKDPKDQAILDKSKSNLIINILKNNYNNKWCWSKQVNYKVVRLNKNSAWEINDWIENADNLSDTILYIIMHWPIKSDKVKPEDLAPLPEKIRWVVFISCNEGNPKTGTASELLKKFGKPWYAAAGYLQGSDLWLLDLDKAKELIMKDWKIKNDDDIGFQQALDNPSSNPNLSKEAKSLIAKYKNNNGQNNHRNRYNADWSIIDNWVSQDTANKLLFNFNK